MRLGVVLACGLTVAGCDADLSLTKASDAPAPATGFDAAVATRQAIVVDASTPDRALKTLWALQDADAQVICAADAEMDKLQGRTKAIVEASRGEHSHRELLGGSLAKSMAQIYAWPCTVPQLKREINDVKGETDSRAVARVTVRNTSPVPADADEPAEFMKAARKNGERYRYIFTKVEGAWRLEDVYKDDTILSEYRMYESGAPSYPYSTAPF